MNLYLRLLWLMISAPFRSRISPLEVGVTRWRVMPGDLDAFGHMNNARYLSVMDLGRLDLLVRLGVAPLVLRHRWQVPVVSSAMEYRAGLRFLEEYEVATRIVAWDAAWLYLRQDFLRLGQHAPVATGYIKLCVRGGDGPIAPDELWALVGVRLPRPELPRELARRFATGAVVEPDAEPAPPAPPATTAEPLAICGVGCRLPGGIEDTSELWRALLARRDGIVEIGADRWDPERFFDPTGASPGRAYVQRAGLLVRDPRAFDPGFFGINPREAEVLDPQQRLLLHTSWEALEDAGLPADRLAGSDTGVFVGGFTIDNMILQTRPENRSRITAPTATASSLTMLSNRLSYTYDLRGPSLTVDTACSSSLVALHLACQSLWRGEISSAIVGGVSALLVPETQILMSKGKFLSPQGKCHAFGAKADGYVRAEGATVLLVRPLSAALRDGNPVYAVIRGTAANQDGRTPGITMPRGEAQVAVMRAAYRSAGVDASTVTYVEAHGTGTAAGDPIEAEALGRVVGRTDGAPCLIGSIKSNLGHLEAASGVTGVLKAALVLREGVVPPSLHSEELNPEIPFAALGIEVARQAKALSRQRPLYAGVNSFGYGGTNAHIVLAEAPPPAAPPPQGEAERVAATRPMVVTVSARSQAALGELAERYAAWVEAGGDARALARSSSVHRSHHRHRIAWHGETGAELAMSLRAAARGEAAACLEYSSERSAATKVLFVYTGMGPQWWGMGRELFAQEPVYRDAILELDALWQARTGWSLAAELARPADSSQVTRTEIAQPANVVLQLALTRLLASWGVVPDGVVGHSVGEVAAATACGGLSLRDGLELAWVRSRLQATLAGTGGMLAVGLSLAEATAKLAGKEGLVSVAAINGPRSLTLAGDRAALEGIAAELARDGAFHRFLEVEVPYHSPKMEAIRAQLFAELRHLAPSAPALPCYSTVTGGLVTQASHDADYWWRNVRQPVDFSGAIAAASAAGYNVFVEIGPHPVLASAVRETLSEHGAAGELVATLTRKAPERAALARLMARLYVTGVALDWARYTAPGRYTPIPTYAWQYETPWADSVASHRDLHGDAAHPWLGTAATSADAWRWRCDLNLGRGSAYLLDHVVGGTPLFPGAGHVELALAARHAATGSARCSIEGLRFLAPLPLSASAAPCLEVMLSRESSALTISRIDDDAAAPLARAHVWSAGAPPSRIDVDARRRMAAGELPIAELYAALDSCGLSYGPAFRGVSAVWRGVPGARGSREVVAALRLPEHLDDRGYFLHPALLDAALHSLLAAAAAENAGATIVPQAIGRLQWFLPLGRAALAVGSLVDHGDGEVTGELTLLTEDGQVAVELSDLSCRVIAAPDTFSARSARWGATRRFAPIAATPSDETSESWQWIDGGEDLGVISAAPGAMVVDRRWMREPVAENDACYDEVLDASARLIASVNAIAPGQVARYFVLTRGAEFVVDGDRTIDLGAAALSGVCRTIMTERPDLYLTVVDFGAEPPAQLAGALAGSPVAPGDRVTLQSFLTRLGPEQEVAVRGDELYAARLVAQPLPSTPPAEQVELGTGAFEILGADAGSLDALRFGACARRAPGPGEVEIEVELCALGFKDIMKALGALPPRALAGTYFGDRLGMEGVGRIRAVGRGVTDLAVGDRVYSATGGFLRSHVLAPAEKVLRLPDELPSESALNLINFMTAYLALVEVAKLAPGEWVLVHGATGGVGRAALEIARWRGARVVATAGTEEKRAALRELGVACVASSRDLSFVEAAREATDGRGVDVVLNFTPGEIAAKSLECLAPLGRFLEIGKMSFAHDAMMRLAPFNSGLTYAACDYDRLLASHPERVVAGFRACLQHLAAGDFEATPLTVFAASQVGEAFRVMARGKHQGKVAVALHDPSLRGDAALVPVIRPDRTYLVTGGLRGFGLEVARHLAARGARSLVLWSRTGAASPESKAAIAALCDAGCDARAFAVDVGDASAVATALAEVRATMLLIGGVFHAATAYDDRPLAEVDRASLDGVLRVKAGGALALHQLTVADPLEHFVLFSSVSSLIGNAGQVSYVAANALLDQLAAARRRGGKPGVAIQWGALAEAGVVTRDAHLARHLAQLGLRGLATADALRALDAVLDARDQAPPGLAVIDADWRRIYEGTAPGAGRRRLEPLLPAECEGAQGAGLREALRDKDESTALAEVVDQVCAVVAKLMRLPAGKLEAHTPLREVGIDSLLALEIAVGLENQFQVPVSAMLLTAGPAPTEIASAIVARVRNEDARQVQS